MLKSLTNNKLTILVVTRDLKCLNIIKFMLFKYFKKVIICNKALEGLKCYNENIIDVILIDYNLSDINGCDLSNEIRQINKYIPIVLMNNFFDKELLLKLIPLKLTDILIKPINGSSLKDSLKLIASELNYCNTLENIKLFNNFSYDFYKKKLVNLNDKNEIKLTKSEILFTELLIQNMNKTVSHGMINSKFKELKSSQSIKNLVYRIRMKLETDIIENIHGIGYILRDK